MSMDRKDRRVAIVQELEAHGWRRAADLADVCGVCVRTIYRDVKKLAQSGVPVIGVQGKGLRLGEGFFLPPIAFTSDEAVLLLLGAATVAAKLGLHYEVAAHAARSKIMALLPERLRAEALALQTSLRAAPINAFDAPAEQQNVEVLRRALAERRCIAFTLGPEGAEHRLEPYGITRVAGAWRVVGRERERVRHYPIAVMASMTLTDDSFERPASYDARADSAPSRDIVIRVRFEGPAGQWVKATPSAYLTAMEEVDGGLIVTLQAARETEVLPWLLSWGAQAHVLSPPSLRRRLASEATTIGSRYREEPTFLP